MCPNEGCGMYHFSGGCPLDFDDALFKDKGEQ